MLNNIPNKKILREDGRNEFAKPPKKDSTTRAKISFIVTLFNYTKLLNKKQTNLP